MILYFAGTEVRVYAELLKASGVQSILQSAFYLNYRHQPNELGFENYVLDSGGFTARKQGAQIDVKDYADFLNQHQIKTAFNLDTLDVEETLFNQQYLEDNSKSYIIPVYHYSDFVSEKYRSLIDTYVEKYPYISLGGTAEGSTAITKNKLRFFDYCFLRTRDKVRVHGLAVTAQRLMMRYPWYSVDSTSWLSGERYGQWRDFTQGKMKTVSSVRVTKKLTDPRQLVEKNERLRLSIESFLRLEKYVTDYWAQKGVVWKKVG